MEVTPEALERFKADTDKNKVDNESPFYEPACACGSVRNSGFKPFKDIIELENGNYKVVAQGNSKDGRSTSALECIRMYSSKFVILSLDEDSEWPRAIMCDVEEFDIEIENVMSAKFNTSTRQGELEVYLRGYYPDEDGPLIVSVIDPGNIVGCSDKLLGFSSIESATAIIKEYRIKHN